MKKKSKSNVNLRGWDKIFYICDVNDGTHAYNVNSTEKEPWYQLNIRPNEIDNIPRHLSLGAGSSYEKKLKLIAKYVSMYDHPSDLFDYLRISPNGRVIGKPTLDAYDEYWKEYGEDDSVLQYDEDIKEAIIVGMQTKTYFGSNVKVTYMEKNDELSVTGIYAEWFLNFVDLVMSFTGKTKQAFYELLSEECDVTGINQIFAGLKEIGCTGIKEMKELNMYRWLDVLAPLVNTWYFVTDDEEVTDEEIASDDED